MKWIAAAIVIAALIAAGAFIYLDRTRVECEERAGTPVGYVGVEDGHPTIKYRPGATTEVCRDGSGKVVIP